MEYNTFLRRCSRARAEGLVLAGMRRCARGQALRSMEPWTEAQIVYREKLGDEMGEQAIVALARFIAVVGRCAACQLAMFPASSRRISQHEMLLLGLIAAMQNGDETGVDFCLGRLCRANLCDEVASAAEIFAFTMKVCSEKLRPLSAQKLERMIDEISEIDDGNTQSKSLH